MRSSVVCDESKCLPMSGSATFATERFRLATPATRMSAASTSPARAGASAGGSAEIRASAMRGPGFGSPCVHALEQMVADAEGVGHRGQRRVHRADAREEAGVDDVEAVELVRAAVDVEHRAGRVGAEAARTWLVGAAGDGNVVLNIGMARDEMVVVRTCGWKGRPSPS